MPREPFPLNAVQRDRAVGALLATAVGDALGVGYALKPPIPAGDPVAMIGRGAYAPGEWTHTTATALAVAEMASFSGNVTASQRLDDLVRRWGWWAHTAKDVGPQTAAVLAAIPADRAGSAAEAFRDTAAALYADTGRTLDATCLTMAVPIALANLDPKHERSAAHTARKLCELTHAGPDAAEATVLGTLAVRRAVLTGELDVRIGLPHIDEDRRELWDARIAQAEGSRPADFTDVTDSVVGVLQAAWSAITTTAVPEQDPRAGVFTADSLRLVLEAAVRGGGHTDTVAAVAGGLLGAAWGASAIPWRWRTILRGWPGLRVTACPAWPTRSSTVATPADSRASVGGAMSPIRSAIRTMTASGSVWRPAWRNCLPTSRPWCRCAKSPTGTYRPGSCIWRFGLPTTLAPHLGTPRGPTPILTSCCSTLSVRSRHCAPRG